MLGAIAVASCQHLSCAGLETAQQALPRRVRHWHLQPAPGRLCLPSRRALRKAAWSCTTSAAQLGRCRRTRLILPGASEAALRGWAPHERLRPCVAACQQYCARLDSLALWKCVCTFVGAGWHTGQRAESPEVAGQCYDDIAACHCNGTYGYRAALPGSPPGAAQRKCPCRSSCCQILRELSKRWCCRHTACVTWTPHGAQRLQY